MDVMRYLGMRVKDLRERRGWSQTALANKAGVPQMTVWRVENGKVQNLSVLVVRRLARAFTVSMDTLMGTFEEDLDHAPASPATVGA